MTPRTLSGPGWTGSTLWACPWTTQGSTTRCSGEFRDRLAGDGRAIRLLELMLDAAGEAGLLRGGGKTRTDSTHVLAKISAPRRLERLGETMRAVVNQLAVTAPDWLAPRIRPEWEQRYGRRIDSAHLPAGEQARDRFGQAVAADGAVLLTAIDDDPDAQWLNNLPTVAALRAIWDPECIQDP